MTDIATDSIDDEILTDTPPQWEVPQGPVDISTDWDFLFGGGGVPVVEGEMLTAADALIMSLTKFARVDMQYICEVSGQTLDQCLEGLKTAVYQNPDTWGEDPFAGWETAEEYLSGNLKKKWNTAQAATLKYGGYFDRNVEALEKIIPPSLTAKDIYVTLGSPWLPTDIVDDFITHLFGPIRQHSAKQEDLAVRHDTLTGAWEIPMKSRYRYGKSAPLTTSTYGTYRMNALEIIEHTLNMKTVTVMDEVGTGRYSHGKEITARVVNKSETTLAMEKQQLLLKRFRGWIWKSEARKWRLTKLFEDTYATFVPRRFDGSFLTFPGMAHDVNLFPYQKNAVARILFSPATLLAHDVGSGKTFVMVAAGMELRRMGISAKNLYVVPNNLTGQWASIFLRLYPDANLLVVDPKDFTPKKKNKTLRRMRDEDFDGIIIAYSCFSKIPLSKAYVTETLKEEQSQTQAAIDAQGDFKITALGARKKVLDRRLAREALSPDPAQEAVCFDELGIGTMFVDEAHNFKNVTLGTRIEHAYGISRDGSARCDDMMSKVRCIQKANGGRGVVFATGTPITNSITDAFIMQKYLQGGALELLDLGSFDAWVGMFAERRTEFEVDVDTQNYRLVTRFSRFHNLPELTSLLSCVADFHKPDKSDGLPQLDGYTDTLIPKSLAFGNYLNEISHRADRIRNGQVTRKEDNMLKITVDGRLAALDLRLVDKGARETDNKVGRCAENVYNVYARCRYTRETQLVFCDNSTPKMGFNIYDELKERLISLGIPEEEIAFIHDADTEARRQTLFEKVRTGEIMVLIGSTFKLGLGVNVQDKLIALHHLDVPWRPSDMVQREGRILRQGNQNQRVFIYRYITEGSFDAYSWQLLETKQRFICALLSGFISQRSGDEVDDTVLDYASVKALAIGNPLVKKRVEVANELARYQMLQRKTLEARERLEAQLADMPARIQQQKICVERCTQDITECAAAFRLYTSEERREVRDRLNEALSGDTFDGEEREIMTYQGFRVLRPAYMLPQKPYVWLVAKGRYRIDMSDKDMGRLVRIDNFLANLGAHLRRLEDALLTLEEQAFALREELRKRVDYGDKIEEYRRKLQDIDKKLGVTDDE